MRWALIGYGGMGKQHVELLKGFPAITIAGVYDILDVRLREAEKNGLYAYPSREALLSDPEVELVTVATPNDSHQEIVIDALRAGKHTIVEKPVTTSSEKLQTMIDAAQACGRIFTVHQNRRWDKDYLAVRKILEEGSLGGIFNIESRVHGSHGMGGWRTRHRHGGGILLDWGVHLLDQMLQLIKEPVVSVFCTCYNITTYEVDDGFKSILTFGNGITAHVEVGSSNYTYLPRWYVQGINGTAVIQDWDMNGDIAVIQDWEKNETISLMSPTGTQKNIAPRKDMAIARKPLPAIPPHTLDFYANVLRAAQGQEPQTVTHAQIMRVMRLMETMLESARTNEVLHVRI